MDNHRLRRLNILITQILILVTAGCWLLIAPVEAVIWERISSLPQAEKITEEELLVNNLPVKTTIYRSNLQPQEILDFYQNKLISFGWKSDFNINQQGVIAAKFSKENSSVDISIQDMQDINFVIVTQDQQPDVSCPECEKSKQALEQQIGDAPGKDLNFIPRYPKAIRVNAVQRQSPTRVDLTYLSEDSIEAVLTFYRQNMGSYDWELVDEVDFDNLPPALGEIQEKINLGGASLMFKGSYGQCMISVIKDPRNEVATIIGVKYNER